MVVAFPPGGVADLTARPIAVPLERILRQRVLIDMAFNMGTTGLLGFTGTLARVEQRDYAGAAAGMLASRWASQVGKRATALADMMRTGKA
jgi:lysozyme